MESAGDSSLDRIRSRQARVEGKKAATKKPDGASRGDALGAAGASRSGSGKAAVRISDGMANLDAAKARTIESVTGVRLDADMREATRRAAEDERVQERLHALQEEAAASGRANAAVQLKWADILERNLPQELAAELGAQKSACTAILASKDSLIASLQSEMRAKDEEYVRALQSQRDDIEKLIERMSAQFGELSAAYESELCGIEGSLLQERDELIAAQKREIDALFETRRSMETRYVEEKLAREEAYARELADMQAADAENYQKLKVKLETDVAILEQQLEHMKFTYLLNTEKLEYNYRVLTERDNENKATLASQRQRLDRLKAALSKVQSEYDAADARFRTKNAALTEEYTRITRQYRELQTKFRHFESADASRYAEVVAMHRDEMTALVDRLLAADRVITEQLLGWTWVPPPAIGYPDTEGVAGASLRYPTTAAAPINAGDGPTSVALASAQQLDAARAGDVSNALPAARILHAEASVAATGGRAGDAAGAVFEQGSEGSLAAGSTLASSQITATVDSNKLKAALRVLIVHIAPCVLDVSLRKACDDLERSGKVDVADVLRSDAVLRAMGCDSPSDLASLVDALDTNLVKAASNLSPDDLARGLEEGGYDASLGMGLSAVDATGMPFIPAGMSVLRVLRAWVLQQRAKANAPGADLAPSVQDVSVAGSASPGAASDATPAHRPGRVGFQATEVVRRLDAVLEPQAAGHASPPAVDAQGSASALLTGVLGSTVAPADGRTEMSYWQRLANTIPAQKVRVWKALERGLGKYKGVLQSRATLMTECGQLEAENEELRKLLSHYLSSPAATELQVPPSHTLRLGPAAAASLARVAGGAAGGDTGRPDAPTDGLSSGAPSMTSTRTGLAALEVSTGPAARGLYRK